MGIVTFSHCHPTYAYIMSRIEKFFKENITKIVELIFTLLTTSIAYHFWDNIKNWLLSSVSVPIFLIFIVVILFALLAYFIFKPRKKIINGIAVDKKGECYCPVCYKYLNIVQDSKYVAERVFFCNQCNSTWRPYLENGKYMGAQYFKAFQKKKPQTICTSEIVH